MQYLNINLAVLRSPEFLGASPTERGTWVCLSGFCADQENSGVISNCKSWKSRKFQQLIGITLKEALTKTDLWEWKNDDLHVWKYPLKEEKKVRRNREVGSLGGRPRKTQRKPHGLDTVSPTANQTPAIRENEIEIEIEKKGKEKEEWRARCVELLENKANRKFSKDQSWLEYTLTDLEKLSLQVNSERIVKTLEWYSNNPFFTTIETGRDLLKYFSRIEKAMDGNPNQRREGVEQEIPVGE